MNKKSKVIPAILILLAFVSVGVIVSVFVIPYFTKTTNIEITNQTNSAASVVWTTQHSVKAKVAVSDSSTFEKQAFFYDDRDTNEIAMGKYESKSQKKRQVHHVTLRNLEPEKQYYFKIFNNGIEVQNENNKFLTTKIAESLKEPDPVYGKLTDSNNKLIEDGIVIYERYSNSSKSQKLSTYLNNGGYSLDGANLMEEDLQKLFNENLYGQNLTVFATTDGIYKKTVTLQNDKDQPAETIVLAKDANEFEEEYLIQVTNDYAGQVEEYSESCTKDGKKGTKKVKKVCGPGSTAPSGSGCSWGPGSQAGDCVVNQQNNDDKEEKPVEQPPKQDNQNSNKNPYAGKVEKYDEPCEKDGKKGVKHVTKICGSDSTDSSGTKCTWGPGSWASECIVEGEASTTPDPVNSVPATQITPTPTPVINSNPNAVASSSPAQANCGPTRTTTITGNCPNDQCTDGKVCGNITCGDCTCYGKPLKAGQTCKKSESSTPIAQPSDSTKPSTTTPVATPTAVVSDSTVQFLQALFTSVKASPESLTGNTTSSSTQTNQFNVSFAPNRLVNPIPSTTYIAPNNNQNSTTNTAESPLQESATLSQQLTPVVSDIVAQVGIANLNGTLDKAMEVLNSNGLSPEQNAYCIAAAVKNEAMGSVCKDTFSKMNNGETNAVVDVVNAVSALSFTLPSGETVSAEDIPVIGGYISDLGTYFLTPSGTNTLEGKATKELEKTFKEEYGFGLTSVNVLDTDEGIVNATVEQSLVIGTGPLANIVGDSAATGSSINAMFTSPDTTEAANFLKFGGELTGQDLSGVDPGEFAEAYSDLNRVGGSHMASNTGTFPFSFQCDGNYSQETCSAIDTVSEKFDSLAKGECDGGDLNETEAKLCLYMDSNKKYLETNYSSFFDEVGGFVTDKLESLIGNVGVFSEEDAVSIDDVGLVTVMAEEPGVQPGIYEVVSDQVTTKQLSIVDGQGIVYFFDRNKNGIKEADEPYYDGSVYSLDVKFNKVLDVQSYKLQSGWNLITIPLLMKGEDTSKISKASEFLQNLNGNGISATHIATYRSNKFITYSQRPDENGNPAIYGEDFNILPGEAYFVKSLSNMDIALKGNKIIGAQEIALENGWNLTGIYNSDKLSYRGFEILKQLNTSGIQADIFSRFQNGNYQNLILRNNTEYGNDFSVYPNEGYFIKINDRGTGKFKPQ